MTAAAGLATSIGAATVFLPNFDDKVRPLCPAAQLSNQLTTVNANVGFEIHIPVHAPSAFGADDPLDPLCLSYCRNTSGFHYHLRRE